MSFVSVSESGLSAPAQAAAKLLVAAGLNRKDTAYSLTASRAAELGIGIAPLEVLLETLKTHTSPTSSQRGSVVRSVVFDATTGDLDFTLNYDLEP